jgi:hypothetical protein
MIAFLFTIIVTVTIGMIYGVATSRIEPFQEAKDFVCKLRRRGFRCGGIGAIAGLLLSIGYIGVSEAKGPRGEFVKEQTVVPMEISIRSSPVSGDFVRFRMSGEGAEPGTFYRISDDTRPWRFRLFREKRPGERRVEIGWRACEGWAAYSGVWSKEYHIYTDGREYDRLREGLMR